MKLDYKHFLTTDGNISRGLLFFPSLSDDVMQNRHLSTAVNSDLTQIESFFNAYFPLNTVDRIRKIDIIVYH